MRPIYMLLTPSCCMELGGCRRCNLNPNQGADHTVSGADAIPSQPQPQPQPLYRPYFKFYLCNSHSVISEFCSTRPHLNFKFPLCNFTLWASAILTLHLPPGLWAYSQFWA
jgi:hypothetical protein